MPVGAAGPKGSTQKETAAPREFGRAYVSNGQTGKSPRHDQRPVYLQKRTYLMTAGTAVECHNRL